MPLFQTKISHKQSISFIRLLEALYTGHDHGRSRACPGITGHEVGIYPGCDASPFLEPWKWEETRRTQRKPMQTYGEHAELPTDRALRELKELNQGPEAVRRQCYHHAADQITCSESPQYGLVTGTKDVLSDVLRMSHLAGNIYNT